jgi:hypothetical protein
MHLSSRPGVVSHYDLHETKRHRLGPGDCTRPQRLRGRQRSRRQVRRRSGEAIGDKFPKHIYHSIVCIGALIAHREPDYWTVSSARLKHCDQLCQIKDFEGISGYSNQSETNHKAPATATKGPTAKMPLSPPCSKPSKHSHR